MISDFDLVNVGIEMTEDEKAKYEKISRQVRSLVRRYHGGEDVERQIKVALRHRASVAANAASRIPVAVKLAEAHRGERVLIFHESISATGRIVGILQKRGIALRRTIAESVRTCAVKTSECSGVACSIP